MPEPLRTTDGHDLITDQVVIVEVIEGGILTPGLHLNSARCLICGHPVGSRPVDIAFMADMGEPAGQYGQIYCAAFLFHTDETPADQNRLVVMAHLRYGFSPSIRSH